MKIGRFMPSARTAACASALSCVLLAGGIASAQERTITTAVSIEQDPLLAGGTYSVADVLKSGRQFFAVPFLEADGHGEGNTGPRYLKRQAQWEDSTFFPLAIPFLRVDGLDSQSCFACHNTAGVDMSTSPYHTQKAGGVGGAGDFSVALLSNVDFPNTLSHILRVPPRAFGSGYLQELALEMTSDLQTIAADTESSAMTHGDDETAYLVTKGVDFGTVDYDCSSKPCVIDYTQLKGVQADLIVRPFQHKGVAATLRSFVKSALRFHHSIEPVEVVGIDNDCDADSLINEMAVDNVNMGYTSTSTQVEQSLGNVAALTAFTGMLRVPHVGPCPNGGDDCGTGMELFESTGCASCHMPVLTTRSDPKFRIQAGVPASGCGSEPLALGSGSEMDAPVHPAIAMMSDTCSDGSEYCIDLSNPAGSIGPAPPAEIIPRLPANGDGSVDVPLFSDLKRHHMGCYLAQKGSQQDDDAMNPIPNDEWLTSKLWGVADNGPWLHDGRARSLNEAILMHVGPGGVEPNCVSLPSLPANESATAIANFVALPQADKDALIHFLETLTIPLPGSTY